MSPVTCIKMNLNTVLSDGFTFDLIQKGAAVSTALFRTQGSQVIDIKDATPGKSGHDPEADAGDHTSVIQKSQDPVAFLHLESDMLKKSIFVFKMRTQFPENRERANDISPGL
jgi:hypothetical protein